MKEHLKTTKYEMLTEKTVGVNVTSQHSKRFLLLFHKYINNTLSESGIDVYILIMTTPVFRVIREIIKSCNNSITIKVQFKALPELCAVNTRLFYVFMGRQRKCQSIRLVNKNTFFLKKS